jgi:hypothetical protein
MSSSRNSVNAELASVAAAPPTPGTPAPWVHPEDTPYVCPANDLGKIVAMAMAGDPEVREADARSIAALPELRSALGALLAVAEMTTFSDQYPAECEAARAALDKAEGN